MAAGVGEPDTQYQTPNESNIGNQNDKNTFNGDEFGQGGPASNSSSAEQNEDDLPF